MTPEELARCVRLVIERLATMPDLAPSERTQTLEALQLCLAWALDRPKLLAELRKQIAHQIALRETVEDLLLTLVQAAPLAGMIGPELVAAVDHSAAVLDFVSG
jgi:hypothetical protein